MKRNEPFMSESLLRDSCRAKTTPSSSRTLSNSGPVLVYAAFIFILSSLSRSPDFVPSFSGFDMIGHFIEYYFLGCLLYRWLSYKDGPLRREYALFTAMLIGTIYGLTDEWHQSFVPGREATFRDVLCDIAGTAAGASTYDIILKRIIPELKRIYMNAGVG